MRIFIYTALCISKLTFPSVIRKYIVLAFAEAKCETESLHIKIDRWVGMLPNTRGTFDNVHRDEIQSMMDIHRLIFVFKLHVIVYGWWDIICHEYPNDEYLSFDRQQYAYPPKFRSLNVS